MYDCLCIMTNFHFSSQIPFLAVVVHFIHVVARSVESFRILSFKSIQQSPETRLCLFAAEDHLD